MKELFEKINSEVLTDEVKLQISAIFESQVNEAIKAKEAELEEANRTEIAEFKESLIDQIDEYLGYFVEEFTKENEAQVNEGVLTSVSKRVLENFSSMVEEFNMQLADQTLEEDKKIPELTKRLNDAVTKLGEKNAELQESLRELAIRDRMDLVPGVIAKEKFRKLAEGLSYTLGEEEEFVSKLNFFVESVRSEVTSSAEKLEEPQEVVEEGTKDEKTVITESTEEKPASRITDYLSRL